MTRTAWVVGAGGLLGSAVTRRLRRDRSWGPVIAESLPWSDPDAAVREAVRLAEDAVATAHPTTLFWCAGASVIGATPDQFSAELEVTARVLEAIAAVFARSPEHRLMFFFASSAGGVYAGSDDPPFSEETEPVAISAYGESKLKAEALARRFGDANAVPVLIGRISNLYGPGQRLDKAQGVISQVCRSYFTGVGTSIYVPLDTIRDYLFVDDAAEHIVTAMTLPLDGVTVKIFASFQPATLGTVLRTLQAVFKRQPPVMIGQSPNAAAQVLDLRFRSVVLPEIDELPRRPLIAGIHATALGMTTGGRARS